MCTVFIWLAGICVQIFEPQKLSKVRWYLQSSHPRAVLLKGTGPFYISKVLGFTNRREINLIFRVRIYSQWDLKNINVWTSFVLSVTSHFMTAAHVCLQEYYLCCSTLMHHLASNRRKHFGWSPDLTLSYILPLLLTKITENVSKASSWLFLWMWPVRGTSLKQRAVAIPACFMTPLSRSALSVLITYISFPLPEWKPFGHT